MNKYLILSLFLTFQALAQTTALQTVLVNQAGYNLNESKRFVAWGVADGTPFEVKQGNQVVFKGEVKAYSGDFSAFNPTDYQQEYSIQVAGLQPSVPFQIKPFFQEIICSKLAYDFFVDVRGSTDPVHSNEAKVYGGGAVARLRSLYA